jgi:hypothetical protein
MLNTPSQTLATESTHESVHEYKENLFFEVQSYDINAKPGLTPIVYDDEIGLFEEQEHRYKRSIAS